MISIVYSFTCFIVLGSFLYVIFQTLSKWLVYYNRSHSNQRATGNFKNFIKPNGETSEKHGNSWETRRDMGRYESYLAEQDFIHGTNIYAAVFLKSRVALRREFVQNALVLLSRKHPLLRTIVDVRARGLSFYENGHGSVMEKKQFVVLRDRHYCPELRFVNTSHWKIVLEEELSVHKVDSSVHGHLWQSILLREQYHAIEGVYRNTLLFLFDQVIMDGLSVVQFIKDFKNFLCKLVSCNIHISDTIPLQFQDSTEKLVKDPPFWTLFPLLFEEKLHTFFNIGLTTTIPRRRCFVRKQKPSFQTKSLSVEETMELLGYVFQMKCSLTSLFVTAWTELKKRHSTNGNTSNTLVFEKPVSVVVDFRRSLVTPLPASSLGNYSSNFLFDTCLQQSKSEFWESVKQSNSQLDYALQHERHLDLIWKMKYYNKLTSDPNFQRSHFEVSDVGQFNLVESDPFLLEDIYIGASGTTDFSLTLIVVNSKLHCGLHVTSNLAKAEYANLLNDLLTVVQHQCLLTGLSREGSALGQFTPGSS